MKQLPLIACSCNTMPLEIGDAFSVLCLQTTPPVIIAPLSATNFPSKVQRQISGPESRELSEGHLAPALTSDEATESHSAPTVVTKTAAELVSGAPPLHPIATEVPVSEDPETQSKSGLRSAGMPKDTSVDASVKQQRFKVEKVEPPVVEDSSIVRTLESGGSSASILSSLAAGDSQGGQSANPTGCTHLAAISLLTLHACVYMHLHCKPQPPSLFEVVNTLVCSRSWHIVGLPLASGFHSVSNSALVCGVGVYVWMYALCTC